MNVALLRRSLKDKWLDYYQDNRPWLAHLGVWVNCDGQRRPSSSFILATLTVLEPKLTELLPLVVDLTNHPDRIVMALGLNFNPDEEIDRMQRLQQIEEKRLLPEGNRATIPISTARNHHAREDETCEGR
jgi:Family of unknown function (DUF5331)